MDCSCCCKRRKGAGRLVVGHDKWHPSIALFDTPDGVVGSRHQGQQDDSGVSRDHLERILEAGCRGAVVRQMAAVEAEFATAIPPPKLVRTQ